MNVLQKFAPLIGRVMLALIFVLSGANKIFEWKGTVGYMESAGIPIAPLFLIGAIIVEIGGGLSVLLGYRARWGALALFVFLIPTTLIFHHFWTHLLPMVKQNQMIHFMKNISIMGGLLMVFAYGPGPMAIEKNRR